MNTEIIDGNKLIAEFMEVDYEDVFGLDEGGCTTPLLYLLKYNSSWNELMPVVEKIENTDTSIGVPMVIIKDNWCQILTNYEGVFIEVCNDDDKKIYAVWKAVIEFIKWHNKEQKDERSVANQATSKL